jgi:hypothetical protein
VRYDGRFDGQRVVPLLHSYLEVLINGEFGVLSIFVKLQKVLTLLCKTTREETWEETLDSSKDENMPDWRERDNQNDDDWNESYNVFECPSAAR